MCVKFGDVFCDSLWYHSEDEFEKVSVPVSLLANECSGTIRCYRIVSKVCVIGLLIEC